MKVSVILPVRDGARHLHEAIDSVLRQDTSAEIELVVIDDGSKDGSAEIARALCPDGLHLTTPGLGPAGARNAGLRAATGDVIGFIDHDDLWPAGKLAAQLGMLADPAIDVVGGPTMVMWLQNPGTVIDHNLPPGYTKVLHNLGAYLMRRRVFERVGLFDESLRYGEDGNLHFRIKAAGLTTGLFDEATLIYRIHGSNMTCGADGRRESVLAVVAAIRNVLRWRTEQDNMAVLPALAGSEA